MLSILSETFNKDYILIISRAKAFIMRGLIVVVVVVVVVVVA